MTEAESSETIREAVGVFHDAETMQGAIDELLQSGFDRAELSLLASEQAVREKLGHMYQRVDEIEDDPQAARTVYVSTESRGDAEGGLIGGLMYVGALAAAGAVVATGGTLGAIIAAATAAGASGGLLGAGLSALIESHHAEYVERQLDHGGLTLWVNLRDEAHEKRAVEILSRHSADDVHVHAIES